MLSFPHSRHPALSQRLSLSNIQSAGVRKQIEAHAWRTGEDQGLLYELRETCFAAMII